MYFATVLNPTTNRENRMRVMPIETAKVYELLKASNANVKAISAYCLDQNFETPADVDAATCGEDARSNFALSIFENALDWQIGMLVMAYIKAYKLAHPGKKPRIVRVAVNRAGHTFILDKEHNAIFK